MRQPLGDRAVQMKRKSCILQATRPKCLSMFKISRWELKELWRKLAVWIILLRFCVFTFNRKSHKLKSYGEVKSSCCVRAKKYRGRSHFTIGTTPIQYLWEAVNTSPSFASKRHNNAICGRSLFPNSQSWGMKIYKHCSLPWRLLLPKQKKRQELQLEFFSSTTKFFLFHYKLFSLPLQTFFSSTTNLFCKSPTQWPSCHR